MASQYDKAKKLTNEQRQKVVTDYAIATGVKRSYNANENERATGTYVVDEKTTKKGKMETSFVTAGGILKDYAEMSTETCGASPALSFPVSDLLGKGIEIKKVGKKYIVELGSMPRTRADEALQAKLARKKAGKDGLVELDGKQYKSVVVKAADPDVVARYSDETIDENGKIVFFEVEPIRFVVTNYADLPPMINPEGTGKAETLDLEAAEVVMTYEEFKKDKTFAAGLIPAKTKWTKKDKDIIIKLLNTNPANVNIIPEALILDEKFMERVNDVLAERYQKEFKAGMKKKDAKKVKKSAESTSEIVAGKVKKAQEAEEAKKKAELEAEEAKKKAELEAEEAKKKAEEAKKKPEPKKEEKPKKEKKVKTPKAKKEKTKGKGTLKNLGLKMLSLTKDAWTKLTTIDTTAADAYQKKVENMFSTSKKKEPKSATTPVATTTTATTTTATTTTAPATTTEATTPKKTTKKAPETTTTTAPATTTTTTTTETAAKPKPKKKVRPEGTTTTTVVAETTTTTVVAQTTTTPATPKIRPGASTTEGKTR